MSSQQTVTDYRTFEISSAIRHIEDNVHPHLKNSMYLLSGDNKAALIDTGMGKADLRGFVEQFTDLPIEVVITHGHPDHVGQMDQFDAINFPEKDTNLPWHTDTANELLISDGSIIDLGDRQLEVIEVAGHTMGSVVILDVNNRALFTGDAIGSGMVWLQIRFTTSLETYLKSLHKLASRVTDFDAIYAGHFWQSDYQPLTAAYLEDMITVVTKVLAGEMKGIPFLKGTGFREGLAATFKSATLVYKSDITGESFEG